MTDSHYRMKNALNNLRNGQIGDGKKIDYAYVFSQVSSEGRRVTDVLEMERLTGVVDSLRSQSTYIER